MSWPSRGTWYLQSLAGTASSSNPRSCHGNAPDIPDAQAGLRAGSVLGWGVTVALVLALLNQMFPVLTSFAPTAERLLYFKLPIQDVRYHWRFTDADAFLAGELTLRIINTDRDETHVVFRDGQIQEGWEAISPARPGDGFYFGFQSTKPFRTKGNDSLIITLQAPRDLAGRGPHSEGVLAAGTWQMTGTYSSIYGRRWNPLDIVVIRESPIAFMECWSGEWPITITSSEGWQGAEPAVDIGILSRLSISRGTNGDRCRSHT